MAKNSQKYLSLIINHLRQNGPGKALPACPAIVLALAEARFPPSRRDA
jgi:hypothetical protein